MTQWNAERRPRYPHAEALFTDPVSNSAISVELCFLSFDRPSCRELLRTTPPKRQAVEVKIELAIFEENSSREFIIVNIWPACHLSTIRGVSEKARDAEKRLALGQLKRSRISLGGNILRTKFDTKTHTGRSMLTHIYKITYCLFTVE